MDIDEIKKLLKEYFQKHLEIEVAYIFGSVVRGQTNILSDIDIAIIMDSHKVNEEIYRYGYKAEIISDLIKLLKTNNIDLVNLDESKILLKHRILYFGNLIYSKNENRRIKFQTETIDKYNNLKYLMNPHLIARGWK